MTSRQLEVVREIEKLKRQEHKILSTLFWLAIIGLAAAASLWLHGAK